MNQNKKKQAKMRAQVVCPSVQSNKIAVEVRRECSKLSFEQKQELLKDALVRIKRANMPF